MDHVVEVVFNDSSTNFSELKSRQRTATNLSVVAIMALAALTHRDHGAISQTGATMFMSLIVVAHVAVVNECSKNLSIFRRRLKSLAQSFSNESPGLFEDGGVKSVVVDEGLITAILFGLTPLTFLCGLLVVWFPL